jgi:hypothetical protein
MNNKKEFKEQFKGTFKEKSKFYKKPNKIWEQYSSKVKEFFNDTSLFNFCFAPLKNLFNLDQKIITEQDVYKIITQVAVANAFMAGLPGKMGVGIYVSFALEFYMALRIAQLLKIGKGKEDIIKYFGIISGSLLLILVGFKQILGFFFSLASIVPFINPLIFAEIFTTNLVGLIFLVGFKEIQKGKSFKFPLRAVLGTLRHTYKLTKLQFSIIVKILDYKTFVKIGRRVTSWFRGDIINPRKMKGEYLVPLSMAYLVSGDFDRLNGPMGQMFINSIRDQFKGLSNSTLEEISQHMQQYSPEQMVGVISSIKGKLFERMVVHHENIDSDEWKAELAEDPYNPGYDIILTNEITQQEIFVSLKATDTKNYVESALDKYAYPVMVTNEVGEEYSDEEMIMVSQFTNKDITKITSDNFDELLQQDISRLDVGVTAGIGVSMSTVIALWPYVISNYRGNISKEQLSSAFVGICGDSGKELFKRVTLAIACGPIYAWWLLAKLSMKITNIIPEKENIETNYNEEPDNSTPKKYTRRQLFMKFVPMINAT